MLTLLPEERQALTDAVKQYNLSRPVPEPEGEMTRLGCRPSRPLNSRRAYGDRPREHACQG